MSKITPGRSLRIFSALLRSLEQECPAWTLQMYYNPLNITLMLPPTDAKGNATKYMQVLAQQHLMQHIYMEQLANAKYSWITARARLRMYAYSAHPVKEALGNIGKERISIAEARRLLREYTEDKV